MYKKAQLERGWAKGLSMDPVALTRAFLFSLRRIIVPRNTFQPFSSILRYNKGLKALTDHFGGGSRVVSFDPYS
jgi:hypothetical protein